MVHDMRIFIGMAGKLILCVYTHPAQLVYWKVWGMSEMLFRDSR
jgi:hypothetical protein